MRGHAGRDAERRDAERRGGARTGAGREKDETRARRKDVGAQARSTQGDTEDAAAWAQRDSRGGAADNQYHKNRPMRAKRPRVNYRLNPALPNNCKGEKLTNLNRKCIFKHPGSHSPQPGSGNALGADLHTSRHFEVQSRRARGTIADIHLQAIRNCRAQLPALARQFRNRALTVRHTPGRSAPPRSAKSRESPLSARPKVFRLPQGVPPSAQHPALCPALCLFRYHS